MVVENSGADISITAEIDLNSSSQGNSCNVILSGYDAYTGASMANKVFTGARYYTNDWGKVTNATLNKRAMAEFLEVLQQKFDEITNNGRSIIIDISIGNDSHLKTSSEIGDDYLSLSDQIEGWMEDHAYKNYYHIQGVTDNQMIFDDVRIPVRDQKNGANYTSTKFSKELYGWLRRVLGTNVGKVERQVKGNKIYFIIH